MKQDQANAQAKINAQQEALQAQRRDKTGALKEEIAAKARKSVHDMTEKKRSLVQKDKTETAKSLAQAQAQQEMFERQLQEEEQRLLDQIASIPSA